MPQLDENERVFHHFNDLKPNLRMMVIDQMEAGERCRFAQCSILCNKEAKSSKNYIHELSFVYYSKDYITIKVGYADRDIDGIIIMRGYRLNYSKVSGISKKKYQSLDFRKTWTEDLDETTNLHQYALEEFNSVLKMYQNVIRKLSLTDASILSQDGIFKDVKFEIESLKNLEDLTFFGIFDSTQFLSKLQQPLKHLRIEGDNQPDHEQIYQVENNLQWFKTNITNQQFSRITAKNVDIPMGILTEMNIFSFIRSWQNNTIRKDINLYIWDLRVSNFDEQKFFKLLRATHHDFKTSKLEIKHFKKPGRSGLLYFERTYLKFRGNIRN